MTHTTPPPTSRRAQLLLSTSFALCLLALVSCDKEAKLSLALADEITFANGVNAKLQNSVLVFASAADANSVAMLEELEIAASTRATGFESYSQTYASYVADLAKLEELPAAFDTKIVHELPEGSTEWFERIVPTHAYGDIVNAARQVVVEDTLWTFEREGRTGVRVDGNLQQVAEVEERTVSYYFSNDSELTSRNSCGGWRESFEIEGGRCNDRKARMKMESFKGFRQFGYLETGIQALREEGRRWSSNCRFVEDGSSELQQVGEMHGRYYLPLGSFDLDDDFFLSRRVASSISSRVYQPGLSAALSGLDVLCGPSFATGTIWWNGSSRSVTIQ